MKILLLATKDEALHQFYYQKATANLKCGELKREGITLTFKCDPNQLPLSDIKEQCEHFKDCTFDILTYSGAEIKPTHTALLFLELKHKNKYCDYFDYDIKRQTFDDIAYRYLEQ